MQLAESEKLAPEEKNVRDDKIEVSAQLAQLARLGHHMLVHFLELRTSRKQKMRHWSAPLPKN